MMTAHHPYLIDDEPVTVEYLIKLAGVYDEEYKDSVIRQTSVAAQILRANGHTVSNNRKGA